MVIQHCKTNSNKELYNSYRCSLDFFLPCFQQFRCVVEFSPVLSGYSSSSCRSRRNVVLSTSFKVLRRWKMKNNIFITIMFLITIHPPPPPLFFKEKERKKKEKKNIKYYFESLSDGSIQSIDCFTSALLTANRPKQIDAYTNSGDGVLIVIARRPIGDSGAVGGEVRPMSNLKIVYLIKPSLLTEPLDTKHLNAQ